MRKTILILAIAGLLAVPALAADDDTGWHIGIEGASVTSGNTDIVMGVALDDDGWPSGDLINLDFGSGTALGGLVGYTNDRGDFSLYFWNYDEDTSRSVEDPTNGFWTSYGHPWGWEWVNNIDGSSSLQATVVDLAWSRPFASTDKSTWNWQVGIRYWAEELESRFAGAGQDEGGTWDERVHMDSDADGIGILAGFTGKYYFTDRIFGTTNLKLAFLTGSVDVLNEEEWEYDGEPDGALNASLDSVDRNFQQMDLDTRINFNVVAGLDLFLGYQYKQFDDAITNIMFPDDVEGGLVNAKPVNSSFSGVSFGVNYRF